MLKIFQARLQQYVNQELPDVQAGFKKVRGGMGKEVGGGSGLGTHVHPWRIHVDLWQNQYSIVK